MAMAMRMRIINLFCSAVPMAMAMAMKMAMAMAMGSLLSILLSPDNVDDNSGNVDDVSVTALVEDQVHQDGCKWKLHQLGAQLGCSQTTWLRRETRVVPLTEALPFNPGALSSELPST
ncbi:hypothetical protein CBR_g48362 [Chara braunii]|uniref:Uncharacterized protein n=1 Tax=Chara braunii TaxID=69332 RepID=A0A388K4F2_CHABU|nr:hypothetical protein CBR_g48362 [Chara braunii]|eukprot:GBG64896.1 hypothetical protein CBR_g48362 [Chara braunii]